MARIELDEIKAHLRIEHSLDDDLLEILAESAEEVAQNYIGKKWGNETTADTVKFTQGIKVGCLMLVGHLYANREAVADVQLYEVPFAISALWKPYREPSIF